MGGMVSLKYNLVSVQMEREGPSVHHSDVINVEVAGGV